MKCVDSKGAPENDDTKLRGDKAIDDSLCLYIPMAVRVHILGVDGNDYEMKGRTCDLTPSFGLWHGFFWPDCRAYCCR